MDVSVEVAENQIKAVCFNGEKKTDLKQGDGGAETSAGFSNDADRRISAALRRELW